MRFVRFAARAVPVVMLAFCAARASAAEFCVSDSAGFLAAWYSAQDNGETDVIQLVAGTYDFGAGFNVNATAPAEAFRIEGGYDATCATRTLAPANTIFDGEGTGTFTVLTCADMAMSGLTMTGFNGAQGAIRFASGGSCIGDQSVWLEHLVVRGNTGGTAALRESVGEFRFTNSLVSNNTAPAAVVLESGFQSSVRLAQLTVTKNSGAGIRTASSSFGAQIRNVVAAGNANTDLDFNVSGSAPLLVGSLFGTQAGVLSAESTGNLASAPGFVNAGVDDFRLATGSPAINAGTVAVPDAAAIDLAGNPRWRGSRPDIGAFETSNDDRATVTVTSIADSGAGTLRAAITTANSNGPQTPTRIAFNLPQGCASAAIRLSSPLPAIVGRVSVDGYSQAGSVRPTDAATFFDGAPCVQVEANPVAPPASAFEVLPGSAGSLVVTGLRFAGFTSAAIDLRGGAGHHVGGNVIGGNPASTARNANGVRIGGDARFVQVGGHAGQRNVISGALEAGVRLQGGSPQVVAVEGNFVGTSPTGAAAWPNELAGIALIDAEKTIVNDNLVSGNARDGIFVGDLPDGFTSVHANRVGVTATGAPLGNGWTGVHLYNVFNLRVGAKGRANLSANNGNAGFWVDSGAANYFAGNVAYDNDQNGTGFLDMELDLPGPTANDAGDADSGPNGLANHPEILSIVPVSSPNTFEVTVRVTGPANRQATITLYESKNCAPGERGDLYRPILLTQTFTGPDGVEDETIVLPPLYGLSVANLTATIDLASDGASEASVCVPVPVELVDLVFTDGFE